MECAYYFRKAAPLGASPRFLQEPDASAFRLIDTLPCSVFCHDYLVATLGN